MGAIETLRTEAGVILGAPGSFAICVAVFAGAIWAALAWRYGVQIDHLKARLESRDDEIKRLKEAGPLRETTPAGHPRAITFFGDAPRQPMPVNTSPDDSPGGRRLSQSQKNKLSATPQPENGETYLTIRFERNGTDTRYVALDLHGAFKLAPGWEVQKLHPFDAEDSAANGIAIVVVDTASLTNSERLIAEALTRAGIAYDLQPGRAASMTHAEILVYAVQ